MAIYSNFFSCISFSLQNYIQKHLKPKLVYGSFFFFFFFFFSRYRLLNGQPILNLENLEYFA